MTAKCTLTRAQLDALIEGDVEFVSVLSLMEESGMLSGKKTPTDDEPVTENLRDFW